MNENSVGQFFDTLTEDYTAMIERCFPRYREMLWALLEYLPSVGPHPTILELGCGTGNLSVLLRKCFPAATIHLVDLSGESLQVSRNRLREGSSITFEKQDFRDLEYKAESFDLIASSISIHHLKSNEKRTLFRQIHEWLKPQGVFTYADQFCGATEDLTVRHTKFWKEQSLAAGATKDEFELWMTHQREYDHHDPLCDQIDWLSAAGFPVVDCVWRYLLWSVVQARKS